MNEPARIGGWHSIPVRMITTLLTIAVMVMIFFFSTEDADQSNETSGWVTDVVLSVIAPNWAQRPVSEQEQLFQTAQTVIRKCAHFSEYMLLGLTLRFCLESWLITDKRRRKNLMAISGAVVYACTDEFHQLLVDGRSGQILDVVIDSGGAVLGTVLAGFILYMIEKRNSKQD